MCAAFQPLVQADALPPPEAPPLPAALGSSAGFYGCGGSSPAWLTATFLSCALLAAKARPAVGPEPDRGLTGIGSPSKLQSCRLDQAHILPPLIATLACAAGSRDATLA